MLAVTHLAPGTFLAIVAAAAVAGTVSAMAAGRGVVVPVVVVELLLGVVLGPRVLGLHVTTLISFFSDLGLGLLFFFAGYEIDLRRIRGQPLRLAFMRPATAAALVGAAVLSTLVFPILGLRLRGATTNEPQADLSLFTPILDVDA
jgi:Kef-type K+ transport system membrane component KefB